MLKIRVPATSANLGPGFDCVGIALDLYNEFYFYDQKETPPEGCQRLLENSLAHRAVEYFARYFRERTPQVNIAVKGNVPPSRGLGSSATLTVAGIIAANLIFQANLPEQKLIELASQLEGHPDNAAPALCGGLVVSLMTSQGLVYKKIMPGKPLKAVVAVPDFELATSEARKVLPSLINHKDAVNNTGRFGFFMTSLLTGDYRFLSVAMEDFLHQPYRMPLVPGLDRVIKEAVQKGALGSCLSGAGPSILAFADQEEEKIARIMVDTWKEYNIEAKAYILNIASHGAEYSIMIN
jgi:homoserine kinase